MPTETTAESSDSLQSKSSHEQAPSAENTPKRKRSGGRSGAREAAAAGPKPWQRYPFQPPRYMQAPVNQLGDEAVDLIHDASMEVIEDLGIRFLDTDALDLLESIGAKVDRDTGNVRMGRELVMEYVGYAPSSFKIHARNPAHTIGLGDGTANFAAVGSPPNYKDRDTKRCPGTHEQFRTLVKLSQMANIIHFNGGYPVEPVDIHAKYRHLEAYRDFALLTDKVFQVYSLGYERVLDGYEIARIANGKTDAQMMAEPCVFTNINTSSPLRVDHLMLVGMREMAKRGQPVSNTPFTLAGAMAPATVAGAVTLQNAETLACVVFCQAVRRGTPVIYGGFTPNVDMKSGAPAFGTPEYIQSTQITGQLTRRYGLPYRSSNANASNIPDAQAAWESTFSLWGAIHGHTNMVYHAAGWMEGGLTASPEKFVMDLDLLQTVALSMQPPEVNTDTLGVEAIRDVGAGGHYFGTAHTLKRYDTAFWSPMVSDWRNHGSWEEAGSPDAYERANALWKEMIASYEAPPIDPAIKEELDAFVARRTAEGGAPTDF
ncbi:MAG: trimethylamine methyltransferase family protein [Alphaproteobacteria bacterium]|nr:trimethylamine methyltransferase family protein [Alphaproteobacteria bacterium]